ncbi:MAG: NAD-binding protein [Chloroflexi bacterium]|nr:NAD-binding protein [Chloroflexota bacterium]
MRRILREWYEHQWFVVLGLWLITLCLGYVGFAKHFAALNQVRSPLDLLYLTLQLFPLQSGAVPPPVTWELEVARLLAPTVAAYTAVQALAVIFYEQVQSLRLRVIHDHVVICGLGRMGLLLARGFLRRGDRVVVIEQDEGNDFISLCREEGAIVILGDAKDREVLRRAGVAKAKYVFSVCGDDSTNAEVAVHVQELVSSRQGYPLTCFIHIVDPRLYHLLREREIAPSSSYRLELFNIFDRGTQLLLEEYPFFRESDGVSVQQPHVLVIGLGRMGESLIIHIARNWWNKYALTCGPLRMSIIDREAEHKVESLCQRYPKLSQACELVALQMDVLWPEFEQASFLIDSDGQCRVTAVYVCLDNDSLGLRAGLTLLQRVKGRHIPVVVRMAYETGLALLLRGTETHGFDNLHAFGLIDRTCQPELVLGGTHEILARAIHESYVRHRRELGESIETNPSLVSWEELPEDLKESNRCQADHILVKLKAIGCGIAPLTDWDAEKFQFTAEEVERMAQMEHQRFVEERLRAGWAYAPGVQSVEQRTSPILVPWDELPECEREKDRDMVRELPRFLARAGLQVCRLD